MIRPRALRRDALVLLLGLAPIACSSDPGQTGPPTTPPSAPAATFDLSTDPSAEPLPTDHETPASPPGQADSAFGLIWTDVPDSFPVPIDAAEADPIEGPVSGAWTVPVTDLSAPELTGFYRNALDEIGWRITVDGPLEDGSFTVASTNGVGCETLTTILPRGDESLITVLYGAGCSWQ